MRLVIASNNQHKVQEIKAIVGDYFDDMCTLKEAGIDIDVEEDGTTFQENAQKKAEEVLKVATGFDASLADDSGLMVDALNGAPGVYSARYAGEGHNDEQNNDKLLFELKDVPDDKRTARFVSCIALARRDRKTVIVTGYAEGTILHERHGQNGFGYDPLFFYTPLNKTFAELSEAEKNSVSHRSRSLALLEKELEKETK